MCTHLIYSMARIDENTYDKLIPFDKSDIEYYKLLTGLKNKNRDLKVLLSIGSFRDGTTPFVRVFGTNQKRREFVRNVVFYLKNSGFDGLEINWSLRNIDQFLYANQTERIAFIMTKIIQQLSNAFKPHKLILSAMVSGLNNVALKSYEIQNINKYVDFVTIMMYDFYEIPLKLVSALHHNPLYSQQKHSDDSLSQQSLDNSVAFWLKSNMPREKIVLGVELYARTYKIFKPPRVGSPVGSTVKKEGTPGEYTQINGILAYFEVCNLHGTDWNYSWLDVEQVPYMYDGQESVAFYEDPNSVEAKANYVRGNGLGGIGLFSLDMDDFTGLFCHFGQYPLVNTIKDIIEAVSLANNV